MSENGAMVQADAGGNVGALAAIAREDSEIKAALVVARSMPRSEADAHQKLMRSCKRATFADAAVYRFPRGGAQVEGPSVDLAREAARCWGNIRYGLRVVSKDDDWIHVAGWAIDLESNAFVATEDKFRRLIFRKGKGWIQPDERDERELTNRHGAICVRNAILQLLPPDLVEDAMTAAAVTVEAAAKQELKDNPADAVKKLATAFEGLQVTVSMLEARLKHPLDITTAKEIAELRRVYKSLVDGNSKREEEFMVPRESGAATLDAIMEKDRADGKTK